MFDWNQIFGRNKRRQRSDGISNSCPLKEEYGGIPGWGGYSSNVEYEIGLGHMAEALHCILGSLRREAISEIGHTEPRHVIEEITKILQDLDEYSRPIYIEQFSTAKRYKGVYKNPEYCKKAVKSIKSASKRLSNLAREKKTRLNYCDLEKEKLKIAKLCYQSLEILAEEALESIKKYPDIYPRDSAFESHRLRDKLVDLKNQIEIVYGVNINV